MTIGNSLAGLDRRTAGGIRWTVVVSIEPMAGTAKGQSATGEYQPLAGQGPCCGWPRAATSVAQAFERRDTAGPRPPYCRTAATPGRSTAPGQWGRAEGGTMFGRRT